MSRLETTRFQILQEKFGNQELLKLIDNKTNEYVSILPGTGSMLLSMDLRYNSSLVQALDCYENDEDLKEDLSSSYKGSNLFPFPNRIDGGKYVHSGKELQLNINFPHENNAIHGLISDKHFEISKTEVLEDSCSLELKYTSDPSITGYPFLYELNITYIFDKDNGITVEVVARNLEKSLKIPVGFGFHPYFQLDCKVDDLILEFPSIKSFNVNSRMLPTGKMESFTEFNKPKPIGSFEFDTCYSFNNKEGIAETKLYSEKLNGGISVWQKTGDKGLNFVQIYTPPHRNSIAIEPMSCIANAFNNRIGLIELAPEETSSVTWGIKKI